MEFRFDAIMRSNLSNIFTGAGLDPSAAGFPPLY